MTQNYFICPRCGTVHDVDPQSALVLPTADGQGYATLKQRLTALATRWENDFYTGDCGAELRQELELQARSEL